MEEELELEAAPYTLQILHTSDQEAGVPALTDIIGFSAVLNSLDGNFTNSLKLSSGDLFIAGPIFSASQDVYEEGEPGYADILIQNLIGWDAAAVGNHEFDAGAEAFFNLVAPNSETTNGELGGVGIGPNGYLGTLYPYLATNLDYSAAELPEGVNVVEGGQAPEANSLTSSVIINVNGEEIGVLGTVTPYLESIANTDEVIVTTGDEITATTPIDEQVDAIKQNIAPEVQALTDAGVNKIILMTHLQESEVEQALALELAENNFPVDVLIGGGSHRVMSNATDTPPLREDETQQDSGILLEPYPQMFTDGDNSVLYVNTGSNYRYLSQLVVEFDETGVVTGVGEDSGTFGTDLLGVNSLYGSEFESFDEVRSLADPEIVAIVDGLADFINELDGNIFGSTEFFLNGIREDVRTQETNLGNFSADAQKFYAQAYLDTHGDALLAGADTIDISVKNGGGIRDAIGTSFVEGGGSDLVQRPPAANEAVGKEEGDISELDIANSFRFNNDLVVGNITAEGILAWAEHGVSSVETVSGRFAQISGFSYSYDPEAPAGDRIQSLALTNDDGSVREVLVENSALVVDAASNYTIVTLGFLAGGGDSFPDVITEQQSLADFAEPAALVQADLVPGSEQDALGEYLEAFFNPENGGMPFAEEDTPVEADLRIQNLDFREDTVLMESQPVDLIG